MKRNSYTTAILVGMAVGAWFWVRGESPANSRTAIAAETPGHADVRKLQQERVATLHQARDLAERQLDSGAGSFDQVERLDQLSIEAELALATTPAQRTEALKKAVDAAKTLEAMSKKRSDAGLATTLETLEAKAHRLGLEIKLGSENSE
jgi:outer membrane protein TolC